MSPRCRRSARIASASKLRNRDSPAPQLLSSVTETHESDGTSKSSDSSSSSRQAAQSTMSSPMPAPTTPSAAVPLKLALSEMHPSRVHQTMAPPSSGLRNGFVDIDYTKTPIQALIHNTPSKHPPSSPEFTFRYARPGADEELAPETRRLMESIRQDAAKIRVELAPEHAREAAARMESADGRKIATAKGKSGRFSAVHMAEFKKMDSIEGHVSSFRGTPNRATPSKSTTPVKPVTPLKSGVKRSQSKAGLDEPESVRPKTIPSRLMAKPTGKTSEGREVAFKRIRQYMEDDASTLRPVSRDGSSIPRLKSSGNDSLRSGLSRSQTAGSLMTPTKSSLARSHSIKAPTISLVQSPSQPNLNGTHSFSAKAGSGLLQSPSKIDLGLLARSPSKKGFGGLKWPSSSLASENPTVPTQTETPGRFAKIKSILKRHASGTKPKSAIPQLAASASKTPERPNSMKALPSLPLTTPGRRRSRHVDFTPDTKQPVIAQGSPSPVKSGIPKSTASSGISAPKFASGGKGAVSRASGTGEVTYPDLSAYGIGETESQPLPESESVPGTFTFRSDHTIAFDNTPSKGFGAAAGQASLRQVRKSMGSSMHLPGSFPSEAEASVNKENRNPVTRGGIPHGMPNKKRHRASTEDEEDEGAKRGTKKMRRHPPVAEGHSVVAPRLVGHLSSPAKKRTGSPTKTPGSQKSKKGGLSLSRLNMLAQPKIRK
ncbi:hypothetical protein F4777DRAFT_297644 [Nemania sp. FL0916]|nr:hypothetical protein F4777DRAFT_297644 [Nemania sp. FL0916]